MDNITYISSKPKSSHERTDKKFFTAAAAAASAVSNIKHTSSVKLFTRLGNFKSVRIENDLNDDDDDDYGDEEEEKEEVVACV